VNWNRFLQAVLMLAIVAIVIKSIGGWWLFFILPFVFGCGGWGWSQWHGEDEETLDKSKHKNEDVEIV